jgi:hypothetical protein
MQLSKFPLDLKWHSGKARVPFFRLVLPLKLTLRFDGLSVLSPSASSSGPRGLPTEAASLTPP